MPLEHVGKATNTAEELTESSKELSEGLCGSVGFCLPKTLKAIEVALEFLNDDQVKALDKEIGPLLLTRIAGLLRLQEHPVVAGHRLERDRTWLNKVGRTKGLPHG